MFDNYYDYLNGYYFLGSPFRKPVQSLLFLINPFNHFYRLMEFNYVFFALLFAALLDKLAWEKIQVRMLSCQEPGEKARLQVLRAAHWDTHLINNLFLINSTFTHTHTPNNFKTCDFLCFISHQYIYIYIYLWENKCLAGPQNVA